MLKVYISMRIAPSQNPVLNQSGPSLMNFFETLKKEFLTWIASMKKIDELKDLGCSVRGRFYDLSWKTSASRPCRARCI